MLGAISWRCRKWIEKMKKLKESKLKRTKKFNVRFEFECFLVYSRKVSAAVTWIHWGLVYHCDLQFFLITPVLHDNSPQSWIQLQRKSKRNSRLSSTTSSHHRKVRSSLDFGTKLKFSNHLPLFFFRIPENDSATTTPRWPTEWKQERSRRAESPQRR